MKKINILFSLFISILFLLSCANEKIEQLPAHINNHPTSNTLTDNPDAEETAADTSSTGVYQEEINEDENSLQDAIQANTNTDIEEEGMSFCDCVKKNKKLQDIMMNDNTSDADFDNAMTELEAMKTGECKIMFPNQNNIDEQQAHQSKVNNCLAN